ncbi:hypothetical protein ACL02R_19540 [Streptomyces sp. MS19]|uniref:hypothetical protein n=1 Tax=Streptomyces sp. MS19 TaxID=3385972 RepID=UPI0039A1CE3F
MADIAVMVGGLGRVRLEQVSAAVGVLPDPAGLGTPWTSAEIPAAMPLIVEQAQGGSLAAAATTARRFAHPGG